MDARLGVSHVSGTYPSNPNFLLDDSIQNRDFIVQGAQDARNLGFQTIEIYATPWICQNRDVYQTKDWNCSSPTSLLSDSRYKQIFEMPFKTIFLTMDPFSKGAGNAPPDKVAEVGYSNLPVGKRFTQSQLDLLYKDFKETAAYLLNTYKDRGKVFVIQSVNEMDWHMVAEQGFNHDKIATDLAVQNAKDYWGTIQRAINDARREANVSGVKVYHGCEVNATVKAFRGSPVGSNNKKTAINDVIPYVNCDLIGLSSYDAFLNFGFAQDVPGDGNTFRNRIVDALEYANSKAPKPNPDFSTKNVYISEAGFAENEDYLKGGAATVADETVRLALNWGAPYFLHWELYDNECYIRRSDGQKAGGARPPVRNYSAQYLQDYYKKYDWYFGPKGISYDSSKTYHGTCPGLYIRKPNLDNPQADVSTFELGEVYKHVYLAKYQMPVNPTNFRAQCSSDGRSATLTWDGQGSEKFNVRVTDGVNDQKNPASNCPGNPNLATCLNDVTQTNLTVPIVPGRNNSWWMEAGKGGKYTDSVGGSNFTCGSPSTPPPTPSTSAEPGNSRPVGSISGVINSSCIISGAVRDTDTPDQPVKIHVYKDVSDDGSGGEWLAEFTANRKLQNEFFAFHANLQLNDNRDHKISVYGLDTSGQNNNTLLNNSPTVIHCPASASLVQSIINLFGSSGNSSQGDQNNDGKLNELDFGAVYSR